MDVAAFFSSSSWFSFACKSTEWGCWSSILDGVSSADVSWLFACCTVGVGKSVGISSSSDFSKRISSESGLGGFFSFGFFSFLSFFSLFFLGLLTLTGTFVIFSLSSVSLPFVLFDVFLVDTARFDLDLDFNAITLCKVTTLLEF